MDELPSTIFVNTIRLLATTAKLRLLLLPPGVGVPIQVQHSKDQNEIVAKFLVNPIRETVHQKTPHSCGHFPPCGRMGHYLAVCGLNLI
jgi:hypothetical protein